MPVLTVLLEQLLSPVPGGTGRYSEELTRALAAARPDGWSVQGLVAAHRRVPAELAGVGVRALGLPRPVLARAWAAGLGPRVGGDTVGGDTVLAPTLLAPPRGRVLVVVHDTVAFTHPETLTPRGARWHRAATRAALQRATAVLTPSHVVTGQLRRIRPGAPVQTVGAGTTPALRHPPADADARRARLGLPARYLLGVGTLEPRKGWDTAVRAVARLAAPPPLVLVGGPGWGATDPVGLGRGLGVDVRVHHGLDDVDLAAVLHGAAALVAPSLAEGFGLPVAEALAAGVPVVHSADPALVELSAGRAVVVPVADAGAWAAALTTVLADGARPRPADLLGWSTVAERVWRVVLR